MFDTHKLNNVQVVNDIVSVDCDSRHRVNKVSIVALLWCLRVSETKYRGTTCRVFNTNSIRVNTY